MDLWIGHRAAIDDLPFQLDPALKALDKPRQRILMPLKYMGIAQMLPDSAENTYDFIVSEGYGKPATRRLRTTTSASYRRWQPVPASRLSKRHRTALTAWDSMWASSSRSASAGRMRSTSRCSPPTLRTTTFDVIFTKDHLVGTTVRPTIWPTPILNEGDSPALDILAIANPDPSSDLTVVVQT